MGTECFIHCILEACGVLFLLSFCFALIVLGLLGLKQIKEQEWAKDVWNENKGK
jgi:hypothetical protein